MRITSAARQAWRDLAEVWFSDELHDRFHDACASIGVTPPQLKALLSFGSGEAQAMRDLAEGWRCDASWVTGIVDGLEVKGYVERQVHPTDRRIKVVLLTPLGEKARERALEVLHEPPESLSALTTVEQRTLRDLTAKVRAACAARAAAHPADSANRKRAPASHPST